MRHNERHCAKQINKTKIQSDTLTRYFKLLNSINVTHETAFVNLTRNELLNVIRASQILAVKN